MTCLIQQGLQLLTPQRGLPHLLKMETDLSVMDDLNADDLRVEDLSVDGLRVDGLNLNDLRLKNLRTLNQ
jgi:hypothetical protein